MKKAIAIVLSVMFIFALTSVTFAADKKAAAPAETKEVTVKAKMKQVTGEVTAVDAKANTITVKKGKKDTTITVDDKTKIMVGKEKKALADVKVGDKVTVHYAEPVTPAKEEKKAEKKMDKKEAAPAAPAAPAAKPAAKKPAGGY
jgi:ABC-type Fe3+-hydroxamate transport system substrate-binding protein